MPGIYFETETSTGDYVVLLGRNQRFRVDRVGARGTHTDVTGPNRGYENPTDALACVANDAHRRGTHRSGTVYALHEDGSLEPLELVKNLRI